MVKERVDNPRATDMSREEKPMNPAKRKFLRGLVGLSFLGFIASILTTFKSIIPGRQSAGAYVPTASDGDILVYADGEKKNKPIDAGDINVGDAVLAYPKDKGDNYANIVQVVREEPGSFREPTIIDWTDKGYVAYSAICTHLSCTVNWKKRPQLKASHIHCNCHDSVFDPLKGAIVLAGPAPKAIPQIPIEIASSGEIVLKGSFEGQVGPSI